jgi:hypothetical protein
MDRNQHEESVGNGYSAGIQHDGVNSPCSCVSCSSTTRDNNLQISYENSLTTSVNILDQDEQQPMSPHRQVSLAAPSCSAYVNLNEKASSTMSQDIGNVNNANDLMHQYINDQTSKYSLTQQCICNNNIDI